MKNATNSISDQTDMVQSSLFVVGSAQLHFNTKNARQPRWSRTNDVYLFGFNVYNIILLLIIIIWTLKYGDDGRRVRTVSTEYGAGLHAKRERRDCNNKVFIIVIAIGTIEI